jgi:cysteine desulfurase/selenocysteine lyase
MWGIIMNTNTKADPSEIGAEALDRSNAWDLDPSVLAKMAAKYFPEFKEESLVDPQLYNTSPDPALFETGRLQDFGLGIVSEELHPSLHPSKFHDNFGIGSYLEKSPDPGYAFLEDARAIFSEIEDITRINNSNIKTAIPGLAKDPVFSHVENNGGSYADFRLDPVLVPAADVKANVFDVAAIRRDFPILSEKVNGRNLIWLDNAATTQKPKSVISRLKDFYEHENSNVHRGAHTLAARATDAYEAAREKVAKFLNASSPKEIVFVRGATEGINLVSQAWARHNLAKGDEIVLSYLEHHANIVPWQMIASEIGAKLRIIPVDASGQLILSEYGKLLNAKTKLVSVTQVSNALGTITPIAEIVQMAHQYGARVLVDGAQSIPHIKVDMQALDLDFFVFSGHKIYGPTGIGILYGKEELLNSMVPYQGGGNMIADVTFERTMYQPAPARFEAGTGNIADAVGLGAAIDYINNVGIENIARYEHMLLDYGTDALSRIPGLRLIGTAREKASVLSFVLDGFTTEEVGKALSAEGIAVRSGHHCAQPILRRFGLESTVRPSLAFYNTYDEIDALAESIRSLSRNRS